MEAVCPAMRSRYPGDARTQRLAAIRRTHGGLRFRSGGGYRPKRKLSSYGAKIREKGTRA